MKTKRNGFAYGILLVSCAVALFPFLWSAFAATHTNTQIYQIQWALRPGTRLLSNLKDLTASFPLGRNMFSSLFIALVYTLGKHPAVVHRWGRDVCDLRSAEEG